MSGATILPDEGAQEEAKRTLSKLPEATELETVELFLQAKGSRKKIALPNVAVELLVRALEYLAQGNAITLVPVHAELTTQQAAEILNVSRPFVVKLLDEKKIPFRRVGTHRRILAKDLFAYKQRDLAERKKLADELTSEAEELGLGY